MSPPWLSQTVINKRSEQQHHCATLHCLSHSVVFHNHPPLPPHRPSLTEGWIHHISHHKSTYFYWAGAEQVGRRRRRRKKREVSPEEKSLILCFNFAPTHTLLQNTVWQDEWWVFFFYIIRLQRSGCNWSLFTASASGVWQILIVKYVTGCAMPVEELHYYNTVRLKTKINK